MTIINPNSIAGITSVTAEAGVMNFYKSDGTLAGLQLNGVNFNTTSGISTFNNVYVGGTITYEDVKNVDSVGIVTARAGVRVTGGNVLVGTSNAGTVAQMLTIYRANTSALEIRTNTTGNSTIHFTDGDPPSGNAAYRGYIEYNHTNDFLRFATASTERLRITSSGDVSISSDGTVHGVSKLTILPANRTSAFSASDGDTWHDLVLKQTGSATNNAVGLAFETSTSGYHKNAGTGIACVKNGTNSDYGSDLVFITRPQSAVAVERLRITSDGKISIGEDDPDGNYLLIRAASTVGTKNGHIMLTGDSATNGQGPQIVFSESGSGSSYAGGYVGFVRTTSNSVGDLVFGTRATSGDANTIPTERLRITSSGHIVTQSLTSYSFNNDSSNAKILEVTGDGTVGEYGVINISGNQDTDNNKVGVLRFVNRQNSNSSSTNNAASKQIASIQSFIDTSDTNAGDDSGGFLSFYTKPESGVNSERLRINPDGKINIGTLYNASTTYVDIRFDETTAYSATSNHVNGIKIFNDCTTDNGFAGIELAATDGDDYYGSTLLKSIADGTNYSNDFVIQTRHSGNYNERFRINSDGNIGIGDYSSGNIPQPLSVKGNIYQRQGDYITWNNGDCEIGGISGYHFRVRTYDGSSMGERLRIGSTGNFGFGTTNVDGYSGHTNLHIGAMGNIYAETSASSSNSFSVSNNAYNATSGGWKYRSGGKATNIYHYDGGIGVRTGATGTAGNAISWIEKFKINEGYTGTVDVKGIPAHLRLYSQRNTSDWDSTDPIGKLDFYIGDDTSGNLPYNAGFIHCLNADDNRDEPSGELVFGTTSPNVSGGATEVMRMTQSGQIRVLMGNVAKQAYVVRSTFRDISGHSSTGDQWFRCALLNSRTAYRVTVSTQGGNYGPGHTCFTCLRSWDAATFYVFDKSDAGSQYASQVRMQSDNGGGSFYLEIRANLSSTSQGFSLNIVPVGNNTGEMTTHLQYYGSNMSNLTNTSSAQDI